jgi:hypothetical protein
MANVPSGVGALGGGALPSGFSPAAGGRGPSPYAPVGLNYDAGLFDVSRSGNAVGLPSYAPFTVINPTEKAGGMVSVPNPLTLSGLMNLVPALSAFPMPGVGTIGYPQKSPGMAAVPAAGAAVSGVATQPALPRSGGKGAAL